MAIFTPSIKINVRVNYEKEQTILKNILDGAFENMDVKKPFVEAFLAYPFDVNLYVRFLLMYPEEQATIVKMGNDFGIYLDDILQNLCTYNGYKFETLVEVNYCRKVDENLLKQIADMTDEEFAFKLLNVNVLEQIANSMLVIGLLKKYSGDIETDSGFESVNDYRRHIVSRLKSIAAKHNYPTNIELPYAYGSINERLVFALGIYQSFFIDKNKISNYSTFPCNNRYFHFESCGEEIVIGSCGISVKKDKSDNSYIWINPSTIKSIDYEKDFIGSTLIIDNNKYKFCQIGNDMKFIVNMIRCLQRDLSWCYVCFYAEARNDANSCFNWATALEKGYFTNPDFDKAKYYYAQAAINGIAEAQYIIANYYNSGNLVRINNECAKYWYLQAKKNGFENIDNILNNPAWINVAEITDEVAFKLLSEDFQLQRGNLILTPGLNTPIVTTNVNNYVPANNYVTPQDVQPINQANNIDNGQVLDESTENNTNTGKSRWRYVIAFAILYCAFNLFTELIGDDSSTVSHNKHTLERRIETNNNQIQVERVVANNQLEVKNLSAAPLDSRADLVSTGKKVVAKTRMVYIYSEPNKNSRFLGETFEAMTFAYLGTYGEWNRIYVPDYGGAYIPVSYTSVLDDNFVIGNGTIKRNTAFQKYANPGPKYAMGNLNAGETVSVLGLMRGSDDNNWVHVKLGSDKTGFVQIHDCEIKFNGSWR